MSNGKDTSSVGGLRALGYDVSEDIRRARDPERDVDITDPGKTGLAAFGYETLSGGLQQIQEDLEREAVALRRERTGMELGPPGPVGPPSISASEVLKERNVRVLKDRYGSRFNDAEVYDNFPVVFDLSYSDRLSEKREKLKERYYPRGDIKAEQVGGSRVLLIREHPGEPWQVFEPSLLREFASGEMFGALGGIAAAPLTGGGALAMAGLTGLGAGAGHLAEYGVEAARGYQHTPFEEALADAARIAGYASAIDFATMKGGRVLKLSRPFKLPKREETLLRAERAREKFNFAPLMAGQRIEFPLVPQIFRQAGATTARVGRKLDVQGRTVLTGRGMKGKRGQLAEGLEGLTATDFSEMTDDKLMELLGLQRFQLEDMFDEIPGPGTPGRFGDTLQEAMERYEKMSGVLKNRRYRIAREADRKAGHTLKFKITNAQAAAEKWLKGYSRETRRGVVEQIPYPISPELKKLLQRVQENRSVVRTFADSSGDVHEAIDTLINLRTGFFDFMQDGTNLEKHIAKEMWGHLKMAMENPVKGRKSVVEKLKLANWTNAVREGNLEVGAIARSIQHEEPGQLIRYFAPNNRDAIRTIKNLAGKKRWNRLRTDYIRTLVANPKEGLRSLDAFRKDIDSIREIMTVTEEKSLRSYLRKARDIEGGEISKLVEALASRAHRARTLAAQGEEKLQEVVEIAGGPRSAFANQLRLGLLRDALRRSTRRSRDGDPMVIPDLLIDELDKMLKADEFRPLLTDDFVEDMTDTIAYLQRTRREFDFGASIETAGLAAGGKRFLMAPVQALSAWMATGINVVSAMVLMRPKLLERLHSEGLMDERILRGMTQILTQLDDQAERMEGVQSAVPEIYRRTIGSEAVRAK